MRHGGRHDRRGRAASTAFHLLAAAMSPLTLVGYAIWAGTTAAGEPLKFGIDSAPPSRQRLAELLEACGLSLIEQRTLGAETGGKRAWGGFAIAGVR